MTKVDYEKKIDCVYSILLQQGNLREAEEMLDELQVYRMRRSEWFLCKAWLEMLKGKSFEEVYSIIQEKCDLFVANKKTMRCIEFYRMLEANYRDDNLEKLRLTYQKNAYLPDAKITACRNLKKVAPCISSDSVKQNRLLSMAYEYFVTNEYYLYVCILKYMNKIGVDAVIRDWTETKNNMGMLTLVMDIAWNKIILLIATENNKQDCLVVAKVFQKLKKKVILIEPARRINTDDSLEQTLQHCVAGISEDAGIVHVTPIEIERQNGVAESNLDYLMPELRNIYFKEDYAFVMSSYEMMNALSLSDGLKKDFQRLSRPETEYFQRDMGIGWYGDYLSYISDIYDIDAKASVLAEPKYDFSIVIPVRNAGEALRYTLETCRNIYGNWNYEIVLSDNSTQNNNFVYKLCCELQDERIHYYRTPRDLRLTDSFEYAILQSKGNFIIPIGGDDGILPWALNVISDVLKLHQDAEIIKWDRGFYAWPEFDNGQQNEFIIPRNYIKNHFNIRKPIKEEYLKIILYNPYAMYSLPGLYINSGFQRKFLLNLLQKTGRLWDGICQDLYMGAVCAMNDFRIYEIEYPITIAGMTNGSMGYVSNKALTSEESLGDKSANQRLINNLDYFVPSLIEELLPDFGTDTTSLYNSFLRMYARGVLPLEDIDVLVDWKKMFVECMKLLDDNDVQFELKLDHARYAASLHGEEFLQWFDSNLYNKLLEPHKVREVHRVDKSYMEGYNELGGQTLDASKYGVKNIADAVQLFVKLASL